MKYTNLESINLQNNKIREFNFNYPDTVSHINMSFNHLLHFEINERRALDYIDISGNCIIELPKIEGVTIVSNGNLTSSDAVEFLLN